MKRPPPQPLPANYCPICQGPQPCLCDLTPPAWVIKLDAIKNVKRRQKAVIKLYRSGRINDFQLWQVLSTNDSRFSVTHARQIYNALGFVPFAGFPLSKVP